MLGPDLTLREWEAIRNEVTIHLGGLDEELQGAKARATDRPGVNAYRTEVEDLGRRVAAVENFLREL